jgi:phosphodiesterase/alkaline phosphatase D-like protein
MKAKLLSVFLALLCFLQFAKAQIVVTSPATGANITQCGDMSIYFTGSTSATGQIYKGGVFVASTNSLTGWGTNGFTISNLTPGNDYQLKVIDSGNPSLFGWSGTFSVVAFTAPVSTAATSVTTTSATVNWNAVSGATDYRIDISTASDFSSFVYIYNNLSTSTLTGSATSKVIYSGLTAGTTYYYRLRAVKAACTSANSNVTSFLTLPSAPSSLTASGISLTTFTLTWPAVQSATQYDVDLSTSASFTTFTTTVVTSPTINKTGIPSGVTHYVRVKAKNTTGYSGYISKTIQLQTPPVATTASNVSYTSFTANCTPNGATSTAMFLDVSTDPAFSSFVGSYNDFYSGSQNVTVTGLTASTIYYYRFRQELSSGRSINSNVISQITLPSPVLTVSNITLTSFLMSWPAVTSATEYEIDLSTSSSFSTFTTDVVTGTSISKTGLPSGITHYIRARAKNSVGSSQNALKTIQLQAPPVVGLPSSITSTGFTANCTPNSIGSVILFLDVSIDPGFGSFVGGYNNYYSGSQNVTVTGLNPGTTYYYRFRQSLTSGISVNSSTMTVNTCPDIPVIETLITDISTVSFRIRWASVPTAASYTIQASRNDTFTNLVGVDPQPQSIPGASTSLLVKSNSTTDLLNNTTYYVRIRANNASGSSQYSNFVFATTGSFTPSAGAASSITNNSFQANWSSVSGSSGYRMDVSTNNTFTAMVPGYTDISVTGTAKSITGLTACTNYYYRVRSVTPTGLSWYSNTVGPVTTSTAAPLAPTPTTASEVQPASFQANWSAATGGCATVDYRLDVASDPSFTTLILNNLLVSVTNYTVTGLTSGVTYYYRVRASNSSGTSGNSASMPVTTGNFSPVLLQPNNITNTSFTANWQATPGAISYTIDVSTNALFSSKVSGYDNLTVSGTSQNVVGLTAQTVYYYRIRSLTPSGYSITNTSSVLTAPNPPGGLFVNQLASTSFTANWGTVPLVSDYEIDVSTDIDFSTFVGIYNDVTINATSLNITGLTPNTPYYFRVRAKNASGSSPNSTVSSLITLPPQPTATSATSIASTSFTANWNSLGGALSYRLDVSTNSTFASGFILGYNDLVVNSTSQSVTGLTAGTTYYYRVRAVHLSGTSSASNTINTMTSPVAPTASASSILFSSFTANSTASPTATEYRLDVSTSSSFATYLPGFQDFAIPSGASFYLVTGLTANTQYYFRIRARNASGTSTSSATVPVLTQLATPSPGHSALTTTSFTVSWSAISGATEYRLDVSTSSNFSSGIIENNTQVLSTSKVLTGLTPNTLYYYRVRAANATPNTSASSSTGPATTLSNAPVATSATGTGSTYFYANWFSTGASTYEIDVSTNSSFSTFISGYSNTNVGNTIIRNVFGLTPSTVYYYRVRAVNAGGSSANSNTISVTTLCPGCRIDPDQADNADAPESSENNEPSLYPNSVETQLNVVLPSMMQKSANTAFRVFDLTGREFTVSFVKNTKEEYEANVSVLHGGMYILSVESEKSKYRIRFLKK